MRRLVDRCDMMPTVNARIQDALVMAIRRAIRQSRPTLQPQMLALLQVCISPSTHPTQVSASHRRNRSQVLDKPRSMSDSESDLALVQVIVEGITSPQNRSLLQSWVDFVLAIAPSLTRRQTTVLMLCECFSGQLRRAMVDLRAAYQDTSNPAVAQVEPALLLSGLEQLISIVFTSTRSTRTSEDGTKPSGDGSSSGILGLVSGVFTVEAPTNDKVSHFCLAKAGNRG